MTYETEHIASTLRNARQAKGLTQREMGTRAAVPQSHISKIENGAVDLRVSSLVELSRVLDLELMLVPRRVASAVQAVIGSDVQRAFLDKAPGDQALRELTQLQEDVAELAKADPSDVELAQLAGQIRQLQHFRIPAQHLDTIRSVRQAVQACRNRPESLDAVRDWLSRLVRLRNRLARGLGSSEEGASPPPAYSLDDDHHG